MTEFPPSMTLARLSERTSANGTRYLAGYLGVLRIAAVRTKAADEDGNPVWTLMISNGMLMLGLQEPAKERKPRRPRQRRERKPRTPAAEAE